MILKYGSLVRICPALSW